MSLGTLDAARLQSLIGRTATRRHISGDNLSKAAEYFGVTELWLSKGEGPKYRGTSNKVSEEPPGLYVVSNRTPTRTSDFDKQGLGDEWFRRERLDSRRCFLTCALDMSMWPCIADGDTCLVNKDQVNPTELDGKLVALADGDGIHIRRLYVSPTGKARIACDNPDKTRHPDEQLDKAELESLDIIGRVRWRAGNT